MATKQENMVELKKLNVEFDPTANAKDIENLLKEKQKETGGNSSSESEGNETPDNAKYVWLKVRSYVSENERLNAGFYVMGKVPERLTKVSAVTCEIFEAGKVPHRKLFDIAEWSGINVKNFVGTDEELTSKLVTEPKPFV